MRIRDTLPPFQGVAVGQTAVLNLPIGRTYHGIGIIHDANCTLAEMEGIRLIANGKTIREYASGTVLNALNMSEGLATDGGTHLWLPLDQIGLKTKAGNELTAIGTGYGTDNDGKEFGHAGDPLRIETLSLEIDIAGAAAGVALSAYAVQSAPSPSGLIRIVRKYNHSIAGAGELQIDNIPRRGLLNRLSMIDSASEVTNLRIERDNVVLHNVPVAHYALELADGIRAPQSGYFYWDPSGPEGYGAQALPLNNVQDFRAKLTCGDATNITTYAEYIGTIKD